MRLWRTRVSAFWPSSSKVAPLGKIPLYSKAEGGSENGKGAFQDFYGRPAESPSPPVHAGPKSPRRPFGKGRRSALARGGRARSSRFRECSQTEVRRESMENFRIRPFDFSLGFQRGPRRETHAQVPAASSPLTGNRRTLPHARKPQPRSRKLSYFPAASLSKSALSTSSHGTAKSPRPMCP